MYDIALVRKDCLCSDFNQLYFHSYRKKTAKSDFPVLELFFLKALCDPGGKVGMNSQGLSNVLTFLVSFKCYVRGIYTLMDDWISNK